MKATSSKNCHNCQLYLNCKDDKKGRSYVCTKWINLFEEEISEQAAIKSKRMRKNGDLDDLSLTEETEEEFNLKLDEIFSSKSTVISDPRLDDRDHPLAPNWASWLMDREYLGILPFQKQLEIGLRLFADVCPVCTPGFYESDPEDWSHKARPDSFLSELQLLEHGICPHCGGNRYQFRKKKLINDYSGLIFVAGQRSSKSVLTALLTTYVLHRYLKLKSPSSFFRLLKSTTLHGTYTAGTFGQAKESLYDPFDALISESMWFKNYHAWLEDRGNVIGEELFKNRESFLVYKHAGLTHSVSSPNKRNLRGRARFFASVDEIGWASADDDKVTASGLEIQEALSRSLQTVRSAARRIRKSGVIDVPFPLEANISSPSDINDPIMTLIRRYKGSKTYYTVHLPTWKVNPDISKKDLKEYFDADAAKAWRDYGAVPPLSANAFVDSLDRWVECISDSRNAFKIEQKTVKSGPTKRIITTGNLHWKWTDPEGPGRLLAIDIGISNNSFAFIVLHVDGDDVVVDAVGELIPSQTAPVSITKTFKKILKPICEKLNVVAAVCDTWQSHKLMEEFEDLGITTAEVKLKYPAFVSWREDGLNAGRLIIPKPEMKLEKIKETSENYRTAFLGKPISHMLHQSVTVVDRIKDVTKGNNNTDDLFRALVLGYHVATENQEIRDMISGESEHFVEGGVISNLNSNTEHTLEEGIISVASRTGNSQTNSTENREKPENAGNVAGLVSMGRQGR